ncbi:lipoprotein-releasing ABC transporter permease subunit [Candidatus Methylomirabilis sp.]|uniref:lipoprotein-releasing ABC transporter permease subunit n=1 Tax=Candidatus Methylomirabilis sp. TaxID=2032687 RepID=UPI002A692D22|nr:lipoprotein-releasing ABC transporter permease subunit [Candidatus Methylomirabilis sp.]
MPFELFVGLRYLKARRGQAFISLITLISIGGVALGVMALIVVLAVMSGFERDLRSKILGTNAHLWIIRYGDRGVEEPARTLAQVRDVPHVVAVSPFTYHQVMLSAGRGAGGAVLRGIDLDSAREVTALTRSFTEVDPARLTGPAEGSGWHLDPEGIIIGRALATNLGVGLGGRVNVISPFGNVMTPFGLAPRMRSFTVAGIFEMGMYEYDSALAYIGITAAQQLFQMGQSVTGIEVKVDDLYRAKEVGAEIQRRLGFPYVAKDWMQLHRNLFAALKLEKIAMFIILTMIVLVAAFNIVSTLIMKVMDKGAEIGILKSIGATSRSIMLIFMVEGLVIGLVGTLLGTAGGAIICKLQETYKIVRLQGDVYLLDALPILMKETDLILIASSTLVLSFLATLYPSWRAARLDPVVAIRYE